jgi:hypothetical protein
MTLVVGRGRLWEVLFLAVFLGCCVAIHIFFVIHSGDSGLEWLLRISVVTPTTYDVATD